MLKNANIHLKLLVRAQSLVSSRAMQPFLLEHHIVVDRSTTLTTLPTLPYSTVPYPARLRV